MWTERFQQGEDISMNKFVCISRVYLVGGVVGYWHNCFWEKRVGLPKHIAKWTFSSYLTWQNIEGKCTLYVRKKRKAPKNKTDLCSWLEVPMHAVWTPQDTTPTRIPTLQGPSAPWEPERDTSCNPACCTKSRAGEALLIINPAEHGSAPWQRRGRYGRGQM